MIFFIILIALTVTLLLNFIFLKKIENKTYKICMGALNIILSFSICNFIYCRRNRKKSFKFIYRFRDKTS